MAIWYQRVSSSGIKNDQEEKNKQKQNKNKTTYETQRKTKSKKPDIHATNLQRQDKEIQHVKYEEL